eukprot:448306_1
MASESVASPNVDLNGVWEYSSMENLDNFLIDMEVGWAKRTLAASIAAVVTCTYTVIQHGNHIRQTISTPIGGTTREYTVGDGKVYKYKAHKQSDMESKYIWNHDKTVLHGESTNVTRNKSYAYTLRIIQNDEGPDTLALTTYCKTGTSMSVFFIKQSTH